VAGLLFCELCDPNLHLRNTKSDKNFKDLAELGGALKWQMKKIKILASLRSP
jgi:hypothetical protein